MKTLTASVAVLTVCAMHAQQHSHGWHTNCSPPTSAAPTYTTGGNYEKPPLPATGRPSSKAGATDADDCAS